MRNECCSFRRVSQEEHNAPQCSTGRVPCRAVPCGAHLRDAREAGHERLAAVEHRHRLDDDARNGRHAPARRGQRHACMHVVMWFCAHVLAHAQRWIALHCIALACTLMRPGMSREATDQIRRHRAAGHGHGLYAMAPAPHASAHCQHAMHGCMDARMRGLPRPAHLSAAVCSSASALAMRRPGGASGPCSSRYAMPSSSRLDPGAGAGALQMFGRQAADQDHDRAVHARCHVMPCLIKQHAACAQVASGTGLQVAEPCTPASCGQVMWGQVRCEV